MFHSDTAWANSYLRPSLYTRCVLGFLKLLFVHNISMNACARVCVCVCVCVWVCPSRKALITSGVIWCDTVLQPGHLH